MDDHGNVEPPPATSRLLKFPTPRWPADGGRIWQGLHGDHEDPEAVDQSRTYRGCVHDKTRGGLDFTRNMGADSRKVLGER